MPEPSQKSPEYDSGTPARGSARGPVEVAGWSLRGEQRLQSLPSSLGSEHERAEVARLLDTSLRLSQNTVYRNPSGAEERAFLERFTGRIGVKREGDRDSLMLLVNSRDVEPLRRDFFEQVASIALRCAARRDEPPGCVPALRLVFEHHPSAATLVHRAFAGAVMPDNRCGMARVAGEVNPNLQRELFEIVFDTLIPESAAFRSGMPNAEGIAMCALQLHDSLRLLQRIERLFDRDTPMYEAALSPYRQGVVKDLDYLIARDKGSTAVEVLKRCLTHPLSVEEQATVVEPMIMRIGSNEVSPEAVVAFLAIPGVCAWLASDRVHSELLSRPSFVNQPIVREVLREVLHASADPQRPPDTVRALLRMVRYLGRIEGAASSPMIWSDELESLTKEVLASGDAGGTVYCEMMSALAVRAKGCSIAMQSLFRHLADGDIPADAIPSMQGVLHEAVVRFPEVVLGEAGRFREPEQSLRWVVDALVSSGGGTDQRARDIIGHWSLLLQDGRADLLFWGAPLSLEQQKRSVEALGQAIAAARMF